MSEIHVDADAHPLPPSTPCRLGAVHVTASLPVTEMTVTQTLPARYATELAPFAHSDERTKANSCLQAM